MCQLRGRGREKWENESQAWDERESHAESTEPDLGLKLRNREIMTWAEIKNCLLNQVSHTDAPRFCLLEEIPLTFSVKEFVKHEFLQVWFALVSLFYFLWFGRGFSLVLNLGLKNFFYYTFTLAFLFALCLMISVLYFLPLFLEMWHAFSSGHVRGFLLVFALQQSDYKMPRCVGECCVHTCVCEQARASGVDLVCATWPS